MISVRFLDQIPPEVFVQRYAEKDSSVTVNGFIEASFKGLGHMAYYADGFTDAFRGYAPCRVASMLDIVSMKFSETPYDNYVHAVEELCEEFKEYIAHQFKNASAHAAIAREALDMRRLINTTICVQDDSTRMPGAVVKQLKNRFGEFINGCYCLDPEGTENLKEAISKFADAPKLKGCTAVYPYMSNMYTITALAIYHSRGVEFVTISDYHVGFGMLELVTPGDVLFIGPPALEADKGVSVIDLFTSGPVDNVAWLPDKVFTTRENSVHDLVGLSFLPRFGRMCLIAEYPSIQATLATGAESWSETILDGCINIVLTEGKLTAEFFYLLEAIKYNSMCIEKLRKFLIKRNLFDFADKVSSVCRRNVIHSDDKGVVYSSPQGYVDECPGSSHSGGLLITTFTLKPLCNLLCADGSLFHLCSVATEDAVGEVAIPHSAFSSLRKVADAARAAFLVSGIHTKSPAGVLDKYRNAIILASFTKRFQELYTFEASTTLGWSPTRTEFNTPEKHLIHESVYTTHFASRCEWAVDGDINIDALDPALQDVVRYCIGCLVRSYIGYTTEPYMVANTKESRDALSALFKAMGQKSLVKLNKNMRNSGELIYLYGYPFAGVGMNFSQAKASRVPMVLLIDDYDEDTPTLVLDSKQISLAGDCLRVYVQLTVEYLIKNAGVSFHVSLDPSAAIDTAEKFLEEVDYFDSRSPT